LYPTKTHLHGRPQHNGMLPGSQKHPSKDVPEPQPRWHKQQSTWKTFMCSIDQETNKNAVLRTKKCFFHGGLYIEECHMLLGPWTNPTLAYVQNQIMTIAAAVFAALVLSSGCPLCCCIFTRRDRFPCPDCTSCGCCSSCISSMGGCTGCLCNRQGHSFFSCTPWRGQRSDLDFRQSVFERLFVL